MAERAGQRGELLGVVNVNKPVRWPSNKAVTAVRHQLGGRGVKVGHAGTLDPLADGVLVLLVGRATKLAELLMDAGKEYVADVRLGATSTTDDAEGEIALSGEMPNAECRMPKETAVRETLARFVGTIQQRPPAHSAVHVEGQRAYKLARRGKEVAPAARPVTIRQIELLEYSWPAVRIRVECGRGTYVRSLARDLGEALGVGGYLAGLRRTRVGPFRVEDSADPDACRRDNLADWLLPVERAVAALGRVTLTERQVKLLSGGATLDAARVAGLAEALNGKPDGAPLAAFDLRGRLIALCRREVDRLRPIQVIRPT